MSNFLILTFLGVLAIGNHPSDGGQVATEFQPEFAEPLENLTVPLGRDAVFTCIVRGLGGYRVGWVRADSKAIQAIHTHVITHNPRVSVTHSDHSMWHLHIKGVKEEDRGSYMCQINTDPMISQIAFLEVVIPPDFIPEETSGDVMAPEGSTVKLQCNAKGFPKPSIIWRRENGHNITLKTTGGSKSQVSVYEGNILRLTKISRADMGPYLCIASNSVPPSISKRILVSVHFHPVIHVPNQLVGAPINTDVTLECNVEAFPRSIHFWMKDNVGAMIITGERFEVQEIVKSMFEVKMILIIKKFRRSEAGSYHCIAKNSLGDVDSVVRLQVLKMPLESTEGSVQGNRNHPESSLIDYDEDESYYDGTDLSLNPVDSGGERRGGPEGKNSDNNGHRQSSSNHGHQTRISNNYTPYGGDPLNNNRLSNNNNNSINNRRHNGKSNGAVSNNMGNNKIRDGSNIPFQKTVVVSLSPNGLPGAAASFLHLLPISFPMVLTGGILILL